MTDQTETECNVCGYPIADIRALEAKVREAEINIGQWRHQSTLLEYENSGLAANQCLHNAIVGDDGGNSYCTVKADRDRLAGEVGRLTGLYNQRMVHLNAAQDREVALLDEVERIRVQFDEAVARIEDMLEEDDGQAFKEAGKFLLRIKGHDHES